MPDLKKMLTLEALSAALPSWLKRDTKPEYNADEIDSANTTNQFVSASDKDNWNAKGTYNKPSGGIPKSDLSSIVQTSLEKADSALQSETDPTVPSWAKQPNKPSYTQDEVADGSTYKRVTQTEKDTWSGKQNALTTPQMQAVNSGITSEKVTQISTNQTNILYTLGKTGKNLFDFDAWIDGLTVTNGSLTKSGNAITITATANDAYTNRFNGNKADAYKIAAKSGETIVIQWDADLTQASHGGLVYVFPNGNNAGMSYASASTEKIVFTVPSGCDFVTVSFGVANSGETIAYSNIMICMQEDWDVSPDYQPYSGLSNFALTELENKNAIYNFSTGVKNLFNFDAWKDVEIERGTKTVGANSITIAATSADAYTKYGVSYPETVKIYVQTGDVIVLSWDYTPNNSQIDDKTYIFGFGSNPTTPVSNSNTYSQTEYLEYTVPATVQYVEIRFGVTTNGYSATYANIMICTKAVWDQEPNVYRPFALPNYELTKLEAEDRAAFAEKIDSGAKNKFNVSVATAVNGAISNGTFTQDIADTKTNLEFKFIAYSNGAWVNLLEPRAAITITQNGVMSIEFICPPNVTELRFGHNGSPYDSVEVINNISLISGQAYVLQLNILNCVQASGKYSWNNVMICTLADWKISQKYVPYRMSYQDLCDKKASALINTTISSGSLDDVSQNTFAIYSDNVSNLPVNQYCYVETFVIDANFALQKAYSSRNGDAYVRVKASGTWTAWKQCTNV